MKTSILSLSFNSLIANYQKVQSALVVQVRNLASNASTATPGAFILLQFQMAQVTQIGESISNLISQVNTMISNSIHNQKTQ